MKRERPFKIINHFFTLFQEVKLEDALNKDCDAISYMSGWLCHSIDGKSFNVYPSEVRNHNI